MNIRLKKAAAVLAISFVAVVPAAALAADFRLAKEGALSVSSGIGDDLYAAGNSVSVSAPVGGDAFAVGSTVMSAGQVGQSLFAAGGTVTVTGSAGDDVRLAGGNIFVGGSVAHDLFILGGQAGVAPSAVIGGDAYIAAGSPTIEGTVNGSLHVRGGNVVINGPIAGSADIVADTVSFGPNASVGGKLTYSTASEISVPSGLARGGVQYDKPARGGEVTKARSALAAAGILSALFRIAALFVLGLLAAAVFRRRTKDLVAAAYEDFGWNLLYGFAALFLVPLAAVIALMTVIGAPVALIAAAGYVMLLALSGIMAPIMVGAYAWKLFGRSKDYPVSAWTVLAGAAAYVAISLVPLIGWLFSLTVTLVALGTLSRSLLAGLKSASGGK